MSALAIAGGAPACALFASQPPCNSDDNCPAGQVCDLETRACVARPSGQDSGVSPQDGGPIDGTLADAPAQDSAATDALAQDSAPTDIARADQLVPDATGGDTGAADRRLPDSWLPDVGVCIDNDQDHHGFGCALGLDCDDNDALVYEGTVCDDGNGDTIYDFCRNGACRGVYSSASSCTYVCSPTCVPGACCLESCSSPSCGSCESGCSCFFEFNQNGQSIALTCESGSSCTLSANHGRNVTTTCDHATCYQICNNTNGDCTMDCQHQASCIVFCKGGQSSCDITGCPGGAQNCPDGKTVVCNALCPGA
ncbi:MAG: hypothetical protein JXR83_19350 [Deltaproteobacteria bacterium]|nr:hypothetical protein [Deltaproteobacteria bacterium]